MVSLFCLAVAVACLSTGYAQHHNTNTTSGSPSGSGSNSASYYNRNPAPSNSNSNNNGYNSGKGNGMSSNGMSGSGMSGSGMSGSGMSGSGMSGNGMGNSGNGNMAGQGCCPENAYYCGNNLNKKKKGDCGITLNEGSFYKCTNGIPKFVTTCAQCYLTGRGFDDFCLPTNSAAQVPVDASWINAKNVDPIVSLEKNTPQPTCCNQNAIWCGWNLKRKNTGQCSIAVQDATYYQCQDNSVTALKTCSHCLAMGPGIDDYCVDMSNVSVKELDISFLFQKGSRNMEGESMRQSSYISPNQNMQPQSGRSYDMNSGYRNPNIVYSNQNNGYPNNS